MKLPKLPRLGSLICAAVLGSLALPTWATDTSVGIALTDLVAAVFTNNLTMITGALSMVAAVAIIFAVFRAFTRGTVRGISHAA